MGIYVLLFIGKLNKSCIEKHTILIGKVCRLCEKICLVYYTGEKPVPFTDKSYKTLVCSRKYYVFNRFDADRMFALSYYVTTTLNIWSAVYANQAFVAISSKNYDS